MKKEKAALAGRNSDYAVPEVDKAWQAEDDLRTLQRALEINKDAKRLAAAKALARTKLDEFKAISATK